ncbi:MAG: hypothetical protein EA422_00185 [Gemmatimonadales bacterium]|nr:MAG: hypothetical protein EA422_00185 [Gemmatimonadales bacterium]
MVLLLPLWILDGGVNGWWISREALLVAGLVALLPHRPAVWRRVAGALVAIALLAVTVVGLADVTARQSLARPLNLYLDVHLVSAVWNLLVGAMGAPAAAALVGGGVLASLLITGATGALLARGAGGRGARALGAVLVVFFALPLVLPDGVSGEEGDRSGAAAAAGSTLKGVLAAPGWVVGRDQVIRFRNMLGERDRFAAEMAAAPDRFRDRPGLLQRLEGRDVIVGFIESYGISAVADERYAPVIVPRLEGVQDQLEAAGVHMVTGRLAAPTRGGQSWFAHGTLLSGLWLDNQLRYDLTLASGRDLLVDDFRAAGYRTELLMPAIVMAWPEGERLGFDRIHAHRDIRYDGPPFNWVTMPDQFTWWYLERELRRGATDPRPLFAVVGLISSHAPWTPILPVLDDWEGLGDGEVFRQWEGAGEAPADLWRDSERVREHFALSVDYALGAMAGWAERFVDDGTLLIALGDHQPAPLITGDDASPDAPVHVMARDPALLEPFLEWGFVPGALPPREAGVGMDRFRGWFVEAFSGEASAAGVGDRGDSPE